MANVLLNVQMANITIMVSVMLVIILVPHVLLRINVHLVLKIYYLMVILVLPNVLKVPIRLIMPVLNVMKNALLVHHQNHAQLVLKDPSCKELFANQLVIMDTTLMKEHVLLAIPIVQHVQMLKHVLNALMVIN